MFSLIRACLSSPYATAVVALLATVALVQQQWPNAGHGVLASSTRRPPPRRAPPPDGIMLALESPTVGDDVLGWVISDIRGGEHDALELDVQQDETRLTVTVVTHGAWSHSPPVTTGTYDLFYSTPRSGSVDAEELTSLLHALAHRLESASSASSADGGR